MADDATLLALAQKLRRISIQSTSAAGAGHPTSCMSCAEVIAVLLFDEMRYDPKDPQARNADAFVLSKGHAAPILRAALSLAGATDADPVTPGPPGSPLPFPGRSLQPVGFGEGSPLPGRSLQPVGFGEGSPLPGRRLQPVGFGEGSPLPGQGLSTSLGIWLGRRMDRVPARVYCLMGDGETAEGSVWEAAQLAAHHRADGLCAIVDVNALGQSGPTMLGHDLEAFAARFRAFGWDARTVEGHDVAALRAAFEAARQVHGRPQAIIARTEKGRGFPDVAGKGGWHGRPFGQGDEERRALAAVGDPEVQVEVFARAVPARRPYPPVPLSIDDPALEPAYTPGDEVATCEAYGAALAKLGRCSASVVALDGDTKGATFAARFKDEYPDRFFECFAAEQNMVGVALGLAAEGKIPFCSTLAAFLTRTLDFARAAVYSRAPHLVCVGSHGGVSRGDDGASPSALEDIAVFRALVASSVLCPSDAVSTERLTALAAATPGLVYLRTSRPRTKVLYGNDERFPLGGSKTLRSSERDAATVIAAGVTVHEALRAHALLREEGLSIRVVDAYSVKPLDAKMLRKAHHETRRVIVVEDHGVHGGLGEAVAATGIPVQILAVREIPRPGRAEELMRAHGIDAQAIVRAVTTW